MFTAGPEIGCLGVGCVAGEVVGRLCLGRGVSWLERRLFVCDIASIQMAEEIVREKVEAAEMFTAFDVSRAARMRGSPERHRHLKHVVHAAFTDGAMGGGYTRTLIRIPGVRRSAWLYHRTEHDPHDYA